MTISDFVKFCIWLYRYLPHPIKVKTTIQADEPWSSWTTVHLNIENTTERTIVIEQVYVPRGWPGLINARHEVIIERIPGYMNYVRPYSSVPEFDDLPAPNAQAPVPNGKRSVRYQNKRVEGNKRFALTIILPPPYRPSHEVTRLKVRYRYASPQITRAVSVKLDSAIDAPTK